ncbi:MAG: acyl-CoA thioesterase [Mariprofundus sp.]
MSEHSMQQSRIDQRYRIKQADLNHYGIMHGGRLLTLCDEVAYLSAIRHAGCDCLTRAVHRARFHSTALLNDELIITAITALTGFSSIWVNVDIKNSDDCVIMDAIVVFAAINRSENLHLPAVMAETDSDRQLQQTLSRMRDTVKL